MNLMQSFSSIGSCVILIGKDDKPYYWGSLTGQKSSSVVPTPQELPLPPASPSSPSSLVHPPSTSFSSPSEVPQRKLKAVSVGLSHVLLLTQDNCVWALGVGEEGQLGVDVEDTQGTWQRVPLPETEKYSRVYCGASYSLALTEEGEVWFWGTLFEGEEIPIPEKIDSLPPVSQISCGRDFILALTKNGVVYGWGNNSGGELGLGKSVMLVEEPTLIPRLRKISQICSGNGHSLVLTKKGSLYTWGHNPKGSGLGDYRARYTATRLLPSGVLAVASGPSHSLVLRSDGSVLAWGKNSKHQVSHKWGHVASPREIKGVGKNIVGIGCGDFFSWAITREGRIFLWGGPHRKMEFDRWNVGPQYLPNWEFQSPISFLIWREVAQWLFLGALDVMSGFYNCPQEVSYNVVCFAVKLG